MGNNSKNKDLSRNDSNTMLDAVITEVEKELACWIYYEDSHTFYCYDCVQKRVDEINTNKEFAEDIKYEGGDTCGYMQDVADTGGEYEAECETCHKPLYTIGFPD